MGSVEEVRRFVAEMARRRVFQVVAVYGGAAFALLQSADVVVDALSLSPTLVTTLTIIILLGFPIAVVVGWLYDLDAAGRLERTGPAEAAFPEAAATHGEAAARVTWTLKLGGVFAAGLLITASWLIATRISPPERAYAVSDPRGSYLVAPVHGLGGSDADLALTESAAGRLMWQLRGWTAMRVVQEFALSRMLYDLGIEAGSAPSLDQTFQMARTRQVGTVVGLRVTAHADSAHLEAVLYDVASGEEIGRPFLQTAARDDLDGLVAPVARSILQLRDQHVELNELREESPVLGAHQDFLDGLAALYDWRLTEAETEFREAIAADSLFAAAHHYLALTLYWRTARDEERIIASGPEIARLTRTASRLAALRDLRPGLVEHVEALRAFWAGDYEAAREGYRSLLERDSSDTEAWLLLGAVEFRDPYLERTAKSELRPRRNLNVARRAFERAIDLSPDFQFGYGHLFALDRQLLSAAVLGEGCPAFEPPDTPRSPPYAVREAGRQVSYCPLAGDSVTWVPAATFEQLDLQVAGERALSQVRRLRTLLEDWVRIHPDQSRPHEELDGWLSWHRSMLSCSADSAQIAELSRAIRLHREQALTLLSDTTPEDHVRLALLRLSEGHAVEALVSLARLNAHADAIPPAAANVYLAMGMTDEALEASASAYEVASWAREDPVDGSIIFAGDVAGLVHEIAVRGATGNDGPALQRAFDRLMSTWAPPAYDRRQSVLLRETMLRVGVAPGLIVDSASRRAWFDGWDGAVVPVNPIWSGLVGTIRSDAALDRVLDGQRTARRTDLLDHFGAGVLARFSGRDSIAAEQFRRVENCPLSLDALDENWGVRTLARLYLARTLESLGDPAAAARAMDGFSTLWRGRPEGPGDPIRR